MRLYKYIKKKLRYYKIESLAIKPHGHASEWAWVELEPEVIEELVELSILELGHASEGAAA